MIKDYIRLAGMVLGVFALAVCGKGLATLGDTVRFGAPWWAWSILLGMAWTLWWVSNRAQVVLQRVEAVGTRLDKQVGEVHSLVASMFNRSS